MADASARRIVFTGASGGIGTMIRPLLAPLYPGLVLSDLVEPKNLLPSAATNVSDSFIQSLHGALLAAAKA